MNKFTFSYPTKVYFGEGSAEQAFDAELGKVGETVMLAYGGGSIKKNGIYDEMKAMLSKAGKKVVDFFGHHAEPNLYESTGRRSVGARTSCGLYSGGWRRQCD